MPYKSKEKRKEWREKNKEKIKKYYTQNKEKINKQNKKYREQNKEKINERIKEYCKKYRKHNITCKLNKNMSGSIRKALKANKNGRHWEDLANYTLEELKNHLESQFDNCMSWNNYGSYWHIDHIVPLSAFNFSKPEDYEFQLAWSLENLQPLKASKNISKGARLDYYVENPVTYEE
jgi:5-methylcytosine-specific restriction endonuclease McrA